MENKMEQIYKQKFDKLLAKAKHIYNNENDVLIMHTIEELFPEIKESEDEKIRKELIKHLQEGVEGYEPAGGSSDYKRWLAWVEKQGEQEKDILEDAILDGYILDGNEDGLIAETIRYKNEKRGGQKYAYKVKPKFNIGDWITNGIDVDKIIRIDLEDENYLFENGRKSDISLVDSNSHRWTILDVKNGDILAAEPIDGYTSPFVAIFKERGLDFFNSYCFIGFDGNFYGGEEGHAIENIHPATKEQRNLLFQKINGAGYEWDVKKKEFVKNNVDDDKLREAICE